EPLSLSLVYPQRRELSRRVNLFMQWCVFLPLLR
ncbi:hypothetical protein ACUODF_30310, partial [Escherichia coli]